jgi:phenylalanyl-tRNA synthetase alpha chain
MKNQFDYHIMDSMNPVVSTIDNFDHLLIHKDHPGRSVTDTYYINKNLLLRTHTSAHQMNALKSNQSQGYLLSADVYRRDEIDPTHYPVFHQMEGIRLFSKKQIQDLKEAFKSRTHQIEHLEKGSETDNPIQDIHDVSDSIICATHLRLELEGLMRELFAPDIQIRWIKAYFPFTSPSWEMEIFYNNQWLEVLGCGVMQQEILNTTGLNDKIGWAFGIGLERIAMVLFGIPDIRLFWSKDERFLKQFENGKIPKFVPFSKYPLCGPGFHENDFHECVRTICGDLAEQVACVKCI